MGHTDMGTDARVFYIALLSLQPRRQNNLNEFGRRKGKVGPYTPITGLTPNPSPRGEGREMPCSYKANEKETKHTTPLSKGERGVKCLAATKQTKRNKAYYSPL